MPLGANSFFGSVVNQMQRTVKAVGFTMEWVLTAVSDCGRLLAEKLLLDFEDEVINQSGLRVWVLGERTAFLVLLSTKCSVPEKLLGLP